MAVLRPEQLRALFVEEAETRLAQLGRLLLRLEEFQDTELVGMIFREFHTLKGSAAVAGLEEVSAVAHDLEERVEALRSGHCTASPELIDELLHGTDRLSALINGGNDSANGRIANGRNDSANGRNDSAKRQPDDGPPGLAAASSSAGSDDAAFAPPQSAVAVKPLTMTVTPAGHGGGSGKAPPATAPTPGGTDRAPDRGSVLVPAERLEELVRLVGEAASAHLRVGRMLKDRFGVEPDSCAEYALMSRSLNTVQDRATRTQMVPVSTITDRLRRAVRDLARSQGKAVRWDERGVDTELDRSVLNRLADSLLHVVRNAVDHGIETSAARVAAGKPEHATVRLHAMQLGSEVVIAVTDDGRGIDIEGVRSRASRLGIVTDDMTEDELLDLTFRPGLSTAAFVTDISGRGVGLDVVRSNVEAVRGRIEVRSHPGEGTELRIIVPITLAVLRCLLVETVGQRFALPFHRVVLTRAYEPSAHASAEGRPVIWANDAAVPIARLAHVLGMGAEDTPGGAVVVLAGTAHRHAFHVDRLIGQRDVVLKGLGAFIAGVSAVAGASVEPDGSILLVLDAPGLISRARERARVTHVPAPAAHTPSTRQRVLVVDDALAVRELQRSILERAGFDVRVAVDGRQAFSSLTEEPSDLVLTDVEMPEMDGLELTRALRAHPSLANIPVLILSSRASDADRQRGLDAGADGYITKTGFDEASLLSAVHRLLGERVPT